MLIREILPNPKDKFLRAEVREKVEIIEGLTRILLEDRNGDLIYCLLEGIHWNEKARLILPGDKLILGPFKLQEVPEKYRAFYSPPVSSKYVPDFYIHYSPSDFETRLEVIPYSDRERIRPYPLALLSNFT